MPEADQMIDYLIRIGMAELKYEAARELGLMESILQGGWANVSAKQCGRVGGVLAAARADRLVRRLARLVAEEGAQRSRRLRVRREFVPTRRRDLA